MIGILDYGAGNVQAIARIYNNLKIPNKLIKSIGDFEGVEKLILPGVGSFDAVLSKLNESGLKERLSELVLVEKTPVFGICVGLQVMGYKSDEGKLPGLGWIAGKVSRFDETKIKFKPKLPHMGWNTINDVQNHKLFEGIDHDFGFYFVHSFYFENKKEHNILTTSNYGGEFTSSIYANHIFGTQFHPEKSHGNGVQLFKNFAELELC